MSQNTYMKVSGMIFLIVAIFHLFRAILGWPAMIGVVVIPVWVSWFGLIVAGYLSYQGLAKR